MKRKRLISCLLMLVSATSFAHSPTTVIQIDSLTNQIIHLNKGWRFHSGDNLSWARSDFNDQQWSLIDPTQDIRTLPQIKQAGISWLRLHLATGQELPPVLVYMFQSVASEVYLDGRLLYRFGSISSNPDSVRAYNPYAAFSLPLRPATRHVLALRIGYQPGLDYTKSYLGRLPSAVRLDLYPATEIPGIPLFNIESVYLDAFKIGLSFILFMLHLSLFVANRQQLANLYAAGMYLLMGLQFWLRAACDLMHSVEARQVLHYYLILSPWISGLMVLIFYSLFGLQKRIWFWLTIATITVGTTPLPTDYHWISEVLSYYMPIELIRVSVIAIRRKLLGARIIMVGVLVSAVLVVVQYLVINVYFLPIDEHQWFFHLLFNGSFLCIPLALSLRLSLEHGWISRQLSLRLEEVKELSARNLAHQEHRQQLLAEQNENLELQVAERTKELREQAIKLKELDEAKSRFVTNLTHEFRTPLSLIILPVDKLLDSVSLPTEVKTSLKTVDRNARHLLHQVNQLLDIAQLENGYMSLSLQPVMLGQLTAQLVDLFRSTAEAQRIGLTLDVQGNDLPCLMDKDKWYKLVYNLLANALKFTPPGGQVSVNVRLAVQKAEFIVRDTGIGIDANQLPLIFDRFYQADNHMTRLFEGTGVGLALVRELASLLGGSIAVESQPGQGSTFTLQLPLQAATLALQEETDQKWIPIAVSSPSTVWLNTERDVQDLVFEEDRALLLIVEDNKELCHFVADELSSHYQVLKAYNGQEGWALTQQHLPDLIVSDVMMPMMDGFELVHLIKTHPATEHIAIILLTARNNRNDRLDGLGKGADEYLSKPFDLAELRPRIANIIARRQKLRTYYRHQLTQFVPEEPVAPVTTDSFLERIYALLDSHLDNPDVGVEWLATQLAMDRKTLYRKLQGKIQLSPNMLIRMYRLRRASELLREGKSVTETAYSVGFESLTYFGQCFKEHYQMTPTEFAIHSV